jgi:hypothetical protein
MPHRLRCFAAAALATLSHHALADSVVVSPYQEHGKLIRAPQQVIALGNDLLGDRVNLYTGTLEFVQTDVSLPGNSALPVSMGRRLVTGQERLERTHFGGWDMNVPHLHGMFAASKGWQTGKGSDPLKRCSAFGAPPAVSGSFGSETRIDLAMPQPSGAVKCQECKSSATAQLTKNQTKAFPEIEKTGAVVMGQGKPGLPGGTRIPPTKVEIVRPKE